MECLFCVLSIHCDKSDHVNSMQSGMRVVQIIDYPFMSSDQTCMRLMWRFPSWGIWRRLARLNIEAADTSQTMVISTCQMVSRSRRECSCGHRSSGMLHGLVTSQKSEGINYACVEAWNLAQTVFIIGTGMKTEIPLKGIFSLIRVSFFRSGFPCFIGFSNPVDLFSVFCLDWGIS